MNEPAGLLEFPCDFPIKVIGKTHEEFVAMVLNIVHEHVGAFDEQQVSVRQSSAGKYISLTCTVTVVSQQQLDDLYRALVALPLVQFVF